MRALEPIKECIAKFGEWTELLLWVDNQSVARHYAFRVIVHDSNKSVSGGLRTDSDPREVLFQKVSDESCLASRVLTHQHDHRPGIEVCILKKGEPQNLQSKTKLSLMFVLFCNISEIVTKLAS